MDNRTMSSRLYYLDWFRVLAMLGIFFFHNARFYDAFTDWHVKNATTNLAASAIVAFMSQWIMPLFFLIAGAGTYYALKSRRPGQFIQERTFRLLIPLVFGLLVIVVPQAYFEAISHGEQLGGYNFFQLYGLYLEGIPDLQFYHLWFLWFLFMFSVITLPIFFNSKSGKSILSRIAQHLNKPLILLLIFMMSIAIVDILIYPAGYFGHRDSGGWNIVAYLLFYVFGYLIFATPHFIDTIRRLRWFSLGCGVVVFIFAIAFFVDEIAEPAKYFGSTNFVMAHFIQALNTWCWLLAILGLGSQLLNRNNRFLSYANEAVLPFYILHQTVIISIGFYVVQWNTGVGVKYAAIASSSFIAIMLIYELLVRRISVLRFLFGMRRARKL
ncbi:MAG: acyltransferase family protein [Candidatus Hermodarchaeia archaeon]